MNDSLNICLPCGLCCDGTLVGFVQLDSQEVSALKEILDIEESNGKGFSLQPCKEFSDKCDIYSKRPKKCDIFNCILVKLVEQKELDLDSAIKLTDEVKHLKLAIEKKIATLQVELQSKSFYFKVVELKKLLRKKETESTLAQGHRDLIAELEQMDKLLSKYFGLTLD